MPRGRRAARSHDRDPRETRLLRCSAPSRQAEREAEAELAPELRGKRPRRTARPIVRMRQVFDLYVLPAALQGATPATRSTTATTIDLVVFRENTEGLYAGVEFSPVPAEAAARARRAVAGIRAVRRTRRRGRRDLRADQHARARERIVRAAFEYRAVARPPKVTLVRQGRTCCAPPTGGLLEAAREGGARLSRDPAVDEANIDAMCMWLLKNPRDLRRAGVRRTCSATSSRDLCAQMVGGLGFGCQRQHRRQVRGVRADARLGPEVRGAVQGQSASPRS